MKITYNSQPPVEDKWVEIVKAIDESRCGEWTMIEVDDIDERIKIRNTLYIRYRESVYAVSTRFVKGYEKFIWVIKHHRPPTAPPDAGADGMKIEIAKAE